MQKPWIWSNMYGCTHSLGCCPFCDDQLATEAWERQTQSPDSSWYCVRASYYRPLVIYIPRDLWYKWFDKAVVLDYKEPKQ